MIQIKANVMIKDIFEEVEKKDHFRSLIAYPCVVQLIGIEINMVFTQNIDWNSALSAHIDSYVYRCLFSSVYK